MNTKVLRGKIVDVIKKEIYSGCLTIRDGKIVETRREAHNESQYLIPGLIDAHIHIESSMLVPAEFAKLAVQHGTVSSVSDPHEIANVLGMKGVEYMIENGKTVPFKFFFGAPSCVPATAFESSGATFGLKETEELMKNSEIKYLAEMMNFPGVIYDDKLVHGKLKIAQKYNKPIDGHAPGLKGKELEKYIRSGISTDHECFTSEEALEKLKLGMKIQIREGSAARNYEALKELFNIEPDMLMLCSDDRHPDELLKGHINELVRRAIQDGYDPINVLRACTYIPSEHYKLNAGLLQEGDAADLIVVDSLHNFKVLETYIDGEKVAENGKCLFQTAKASPINIFEAQAINKSQLEVLAKGSKIRVIEALEGELITNELVIDAKIEDGKVLTDLDNDILKIAVINRYKPSKPAVGFIKNFGLRQGAIASTVAHDSHNIICVGVSDEEICAAVNAIIGSKGGIVAARKGKVDILELPVAGIMSTDPGEKVAKDYERLDKLAKHFGCQLKAPYMTLSFMALLVIPSIKMSDMGLFNGSDFRFTNIFSEEN